MAIISRKIGDTCYVLVTRITAKKGEEMAEEKVSKSIALPGRISQIVFTTNLYVDPAEVGKFARHPKFINGVKGSLFVHTGETGIKHFAVVKKGLSNDSLDFFKIPCNLSVLLLTKLPAN